MTAKENDRIDSATINKRLEGMVVLAQALRKGGWDEAAGASNGQYIRIRTTDYRAVSLNNESALYGFHKDRGAKTLKTILKHFNIKANGLPDPDGDRERRLQAWIIREALLNKRDLLSTKLFSSLKSSKQLDELVFALDEIHFGDIRCDIFAIGKKGEDEFPVVIELKYDRHLTTLIGQIDSAAKAIQDHSSGFTKLFEEISGKKYISCDQPMKMIVWPAPEEKEHASTKEFRKNNPTVLFIEYSPMKFSNPTEVKFQLPVAYEC